MTSAARETRAAQCENCGEATQVLSESEAVNFPTNVMGHGGGVLRVCSRCKVCFEGRRKATADIITSPALKKLIVAGPGTGKSHTFSSLLTNVSHEKPTLVFTLINNLVD